MGAAMGALGFGDAPARDVAVEHEGFGSRFTNAMCGMCFGFVLFIASFVLLGWNEFNYVNNQNVLLVVGAKTQEASCIPNSGLAETPIHATCKIQRLHDFAKDSEVVSGGMPRFDYNTNLEGAWFGISSQILQWTETKEQVSSSGSNKEYIYTYSQKWVDSPVDSSKFYCYPSRQPGCKSWGSDIKNYGSIPSVLSTRQLTAGPQEVGMGEPGKGAYWLNTGMFSAFSSTPLMLSGDQSGIQYPFADQRWPVASGNTIQYKRQSFGDTVGDVKTTFMKSNVVQGTTLVSVIALQSSAVTATADASLKPWDTKKPGTMNPVNWITIGSASKDEMIADKDQQNGALVVVLRFVGFFAMFLGLQLITGPIALMPQIIPCVGDCIGSIVGCALCCMNFMISVALSLLVIGIAWLLARPLVGLVFLAIAGLLMFGAFMVRSKYKKTAPGDAPPVFGDMSMAPPSGVPLATAVAAPQTIQVQCPAGVFPGQTVQVQGPDGRPYNVQVPAGVQPGQVFSVLV